ncbi:MAG: tRNA (guanosine(37)-N1)-methyltransferase TrmD [Candidatus Omnitrophica bacterium]|nr:tRNA (guanosine(37)-N1)-methyltransferase TrmD [Candidatus Omnitrophota bacterium]
MRIDIVTIFPKMFDCVFDESMIKIARRKKLADVKTHDLRKWTHDRHRTVDDKPYGGGPGMVMKVEPIDRCLEELKTGAWLDKEEKVILLTPQGEKFSQKKAKELSKLKRMIVLCGHYEGFDERIRSLVDIEISIGDYILTCGELPAMVLCDAVIRLIPGVLGDTECLVNESFEEGLLEYPQYTRPAEYKNMSVPEVLLSGDPKKINAWNRQEALARTKKRRPDLVA